MANLLEKASIILTPTAYSDGKMHSAKPIVSTNPSIGDFDFARASVATRVNENGLIEEVASGLPRIDYTDGSGSWLLEPTATNLIVQSEDFSDVAWVKSNSSKESNTLISPDGTINADNLKDNAVNAIHRLRQSHSLLANTDYSISIFAKKGTLSNIQLALVNSADSNVSSRVFDLENGVLGEELSSVGGSLTNSKIEDYGNGWYKCTIVSQLDSTPNNIQLTLASASTGNASITNQVTYLGDGAGTIYIYGAQLEENSYSTSYIKTLGSSQTRVADTATGAGNSTVINSSEGVLYAEISALVNDSSFREIAISDGSSNNRIELRYGNTSNEIGLVVRSIDSTVVSIFGTTFYDITNFNKVAIRYKLNDVSLWVNGVQIGSTDTTATMPINLSELAFDSGAGSNDFYGKTKSIQVYTTALSDAELISLTTI